MAVYAYIRVSDNKKQDSSAQRKAITDYATKNNLVVTHWIEKNMSGSKTNKTERGLDELIAKIKKGDHVLVSDIDRLGRDDIHSIINTITGITTKDASLHFCYANEKLEPNDRTDLAKIFITIGKAYASQEFAIARSQKAKTAIQVRKSKGLPVGRQKGAKNKKHVLDSHLLYLVDELKKGTMKSQILVNLEKKGVKTSRSTLYKFIDDKLAGMGINKEFHSKGSIS